MAAIGFDMLGWFIYYDMRGWRKTDGDPMKDWRASIRAWKYITSKMCVEDVMRLENSTENALCWMTGRWRCELVLDEADGKELSREEFVLRVTEVGQRYERLIFGKEAEGHGDGGAAAEESVEGVAEAVEGESGGEEPEPTLISGC